MTIHGRFRRFVVIISAIVISSTIVSLVLFQYKASLTRKSSAAVVTHIVEAIIGERMHSEVSDLSHELSADQKEDHKAIFEKHFPSKEDSHASVVHIFYSQSRDIVVYSDVPVNPGVFGIDLQRVQNSGGSFLEEGVLTTWYVRIESIPDTDYIYMLKIDIEPITRDMISLFEPMVSFFRFIMIGTIIMSILMLAAIQIVSFPIVRRVALLEESLNEKNDELRQVNLILNVEVDIRKAIESDLKKANKELRHISRIDPLTEIANRRHFDEVFKKEWKSHSREQRYLSIILCDVDMFKKYNDEYGHQKGDKCLIEVAAVLKQTCKRPFDLVARYGGEEFIVLLPETDVNGAAVIASTLVEKIRAKKIPHKGSPVDSIVTISI
ncbi:MAG TPA: diguanylate cyclase, partial [Spirochaetota bacterium]|nr:diguanylate cyclase [Spirochaetota bacterium]